MSLKHSDRISAAMLAAISLFSTCVSPANLAAESPEPIPIDGKVDWVYDYEEGQRLSKTSGKPMFVVFRCER